MIDDTRERESTVEPWFVVVVTDERGTWACGPFRRSEAVDALQYAREQDHDASMLTLYPRARGSRR